MDPLKDLKELLENSEEGNSLESLFNELGLDLKELEEKMVQKIDLEYTNGSDVSLKYAYESDSGFDLYSNVDMVLPPLGRALIPTGIRFNVPENYEIQVRSKSGLAINRGLMVLNSPGTVDCFSEDMEILTLDGPKKIKNISIGDTIYSFNENSLSIEKDVVTKIFDTEKQEILIIETETGILEVTPNSEIYTSKGIILAKNLTENDEIINFF
jgi:dUTP pyrophosphatase